MFDIDLMNRPGLQKIISKANINSNSQKQKIVFGNLDANEESVVPIIEKDRKGNNPASFFSLIISGIILCTFFIFGFLKFGGDIQFSSIISKYSNYFKSPNGLNLDVGKSLIINFLSNPEKTQFLRSIDLTDNLDINIKVNEISDLNLKSKEAKFINIIENKESYNASFHIPINHLISDYNIDATLNDLIDKYENNSDVFLGSDTNAIYFISTGKIIYQIIEELIFTSKITITPDVNGKSFILRYSY